ncbi:DUF5719 family protein [Alloscardovia macacae]|uniref:Organic solvents resistance ABC transporter permease n=1 Tax=Alloscardovia macacae TaxID=1160091 RepID=A0A261F578_9BIFI|nr:DUF5719 family protein [Alloscardovia macacae]OZG54272.1 hypothetical protein ALMA_0733 [Alloscardovia macacae]
MSFARRVFRITGAVVSAAVLIAAGGVALSGALPLPSLPVDSERSTTSTHEVAQLNSSLYCPARMQLADAEDYGDAAFQASEGNLTAGMRVSMMGALYQADVSGIDGVSPTSLIGDGALADGAVRSSVQEASNSHILHTRTLQARSFTGARGVVASWASQGDLRGISASSCVGFETTQSFLVPPTSTGWSQQLILVNSSDKATTVTLHVHSTKSSDEVSLETHATATVAAHAETVVDLAAAFASSDMSFVTVSSDAAPVAAVVRAVHMNGLTPQGSDYIQPLALASRSQVIPALSDAATVQMGLYAGESGRAQLTFMGDSGKLGTRSLDYTAHQVFTQTLSSLPAGTRSLLIESTTPVRASVLTTSAEADRGQSDFAVSSAESAHTAYALTSPDSVSSRIEVTNASPQKHTARVVAYDDAGNQVGQRDIELNAQSTDSFSLSDIAQRGTSIHITQVEQGAGALVVGQLLTQSSLTDASVAQRSTLTVPSMELSTAQYAVTQRKTLLN